MKQKYVALKLGISKERAGHIFSLLGFQKFCARWVPRKLPDEVRDSREFLDYFEEEVEGFLWQIVTFDTCVCHGVTQNKRQSV